jgi:hypothetical protein
MFFVATAFFAIAVFNYRQFLVFGRIFCGKPQKTGLCGAPLSLRPRRYAAWLSHPSNPLRGSEARAVIAEAGETIRCGGPRQ